MGTVPPPLGLPDVGQKEVVEASDEVVKGKLQKEVEEGEVVRETAVEGVISEGKQDFGEDLLGLFGRWGDESVVMVAQMKPGVFLFNFSNQEEMDRVQDQGPWTLDNKTMIFRRWTPDETFELESVAAIPIWVHFPGLAPHLRKEPLLSKIASAIGCSIRTDGFTSSGDKLSYARVLIEVYASMEFKKSVTIQGPRGVNFVQKIQYEWMLPRCSHCQRFGHSVAQCSFPRIRIEEDEEEDVRVVIEPEQRGVEANSEDVPLAVLMRNAVTNVDFVLKVVTGLDASSSSTSVVPETAPGRRVDSGLEMNVGKGPSMEVTSSTEQADSERTEESKNSDERLGNFIEVIKKKKKRRNQGKKAEGEAMIGRSKWTQRPTAKGVNHQRFNLLVSQAGMCEG
ncbi:hypothetical protein QQ045_032237 [Rhodiola kirilowii]